MALLLPRSAEAIIAIFAVLKTGAAYVPIDPAVPAARSQHVIDDAAPIAVITIAELRSRLDQHDLAVIDVEDPATARQPRTPLPTPHPDDIAYLIYTSGTTGNPKGVAIPTTTSPGCWRHSMPTSSFGGRCGRMAHSLAFDVSVQEIFGALLHGGRLVVVPESVVRSPEDFHALLGQRTSHRLKPDTVSFYALQAGNERSPDLAVSRTRWRWCSVAKL